MKITDHKLSEGIALTFRVPEGNIKHPLIILCVTGSFKPSGLFPPALQK
ncbi:TPA: hypothetical protein QIC92_003209 [Escherichia coli]|nr:hypothetical protein [Escherichia coli]